MLQVGNRAVWSQWLFWSKFRLLDLPWVLTVWYDGWVAVERGPVWIPGCGVCPGGPIGRGIGLKIRELWVRVPPGALLCL